MLKLDYQDSWKTRQDATEMYYTDMEVTQK